jgi:hypothetical protein
VDCLHTLRPGASGIFAGTKVRSVWCLIGSAGTLYVQQDGAPVHSAWLSRSSCLEKQTCSLSQTYSSVSVITVSYEVYRNNHLIHKFSSYVTENALSPLQKETVYSVSANNHCLSKVKYGTPTRCNNNSFFIDLQDQLNMFRASFCPSSGAHD